MHYLVVFWVLLFFSSNANSKTLSLEIALDADGNPLFVSNNSAAMTMPEFESNNGGSKASNHTATPNSSFTRKSSQKAKMPNRQYVANDPSCR